MKLGDFENVSINRILIFIEGAGLPNAYTKGCTKA
jgi:hypothetical protein